MKSSLFFLIEEPSDIIPDETRMQKDEEHQAVSADNVVCSLKFFPHYRMDFKNTVPVDDTTCIVRIKFCFTL